MFKFWKYKRMKKKGASPEDIYSAARANGVDQLSCYRILWTVCKLSLRDSKELAIRADGLADSLDEYEESLVEPLRRVLEEENDSEE